MPISELRTRLTINVRGAITKSNGEAHFDNKFYENYMKFGSHAINVEDFVTLVLETVPIEELYD